MLPPAADLDARRPVWDALQMIYMGTDPELLVTSMARQCAESKYSLVESETILFNEVLPACRFNLYALPAPEWRGFQLEWLTEWILKTHRFGCLKPWIGRRYTAQWWLKIETEVEHLRAVVGRR